MKNTIKDIKEQAHHINTQRLISCIAHIIHCYENHTLDEGDLYNLCRYAAILVSDIEAIQLELNTIE